MSKLKIGLLLVFVLGLIGYFSQDKIKGLDIFNPKAITKASSSEKQNTLKNKKQKDSKWMNNDDIVNLDDKDASDDLSKVRVRVQGRLVTTMENEKSDRLTGQPFAVLERSSKPDRVYYIRLNDDGVVPVVATASNGELIIETTADRVSELTYQDLRELIYNDEF